MPKTDATDYPDRLPDFCNLGVILRILLGVEGMLGVTVWLQTPVYKEMAHRFMTDSMVVQTALLLTLFLLCLLVRPLSRLLYPAGAAAVTAIAVGTAALVMYGMSRIFFDRNLAMSLREMLDVTGMSIIMLVYFHLRGQVLSPALAEARLQALQARIRPHFLFNSLNAVLSLVRTEPKRAERALENLSELFRVMMADNRNLGSLADEVDLCRQYLELEALRLGDRLHVVWHIDKMPPAVLVPPLMMQPLLENAVYHGIEPATQSGEIHINIYQSSGQLHIVIRNPYQQNGSHHAGNKMALSNIKKRLLLHFDVEASLRTQIGDNFYQVHISLPCRTVP
ncbi:MAG: sensor histidine kinase [Burkholderiales bacterium]